VASGKLNDGSRDYAKLSGLKESGVISEGEERYMSAGNGGQLNPYWTEWLMGYPIAWTDSEASAMRLSLKSRR
jgi:hypothetical protein